MNKTNKAIFVRKSPSEKSNNVCRSKLGIDPICTMTFGDLELPDDDKVKECVIWNLECEPSTLIRTLPRLGYLTDALHPSSNEDFVGTNRT